MIDRKHVTLALILVGVLGLAGWPTHAQSTPAQLTFMVSPKDGTMPVSLTKEELTLEIDGVPQTITDIQPQANKSVALGILLDFSVSQEMLIPATKALADEVLRAVLKKDADQAALVRFAGGTTIEQPLTSQLSNVSSKLAALKFVPPAGYIGKGIIDIFLK